MIRPQLLLVVMLLAIGLPSCLGSPGETQMLTITYDDGKGSTEEWTLECEPPGGSHPDPEAACRALEEHGADALPPVPKDQPCTMIYGGPQTARVAGTWHGQEIDASLSRVNGCEIGRWKALAGMLPEV